MIVHFIGAGHHAADLITLRGRDLIAACPVCLYARALIPQALLSHCPPRRPGHQHGAPLSPDRIVEEIKSARTDGYDVGISLCVPSPKLRLLADDQSSQRLADGIALIASTMDQPCLRLDDFWHAVPFTHQGLDAGSVLPCQSMHHFPEHDGVNALECAHREVGELVELGRRRPMYPAAKSAFRRLSRVGEGDISDL
ncbi:SAM-dependent methyltransferase [Rhodospirillum sp. A1_3_36]|uniref:SAM-dependent methyltransferase n=1 Tax=Rhodospirillum sp. A1_3_36 TaxID=3391666 RepID=UPI0039A523C6